LNTTEVETIVTLISEEVKEIGHQLASEEGLTLDDAEAILADNVQDWQRRLLQVCFSQRAIEEEDTPITCPTCNQQMKRLRKRSKWITTMCGEILVERWIYICPCGHQHAPWEESEQLKEKYTNRTAETMCRLSARLDFREAAEELSYHGISVSHTTLQQKVISWSEDQSVSDWLDDQSLEDNQRWYVSCDGCQTNSPDGWHEVKTGCLYRDYPQHGPNSEAHAIPESIRYVASRTDANAFGEAWFNLAHQSGIYRDGSQEQEVVVVADGAAWIWNLAQTYFPDAVEIIDYPHAVGHLWDIAKKAYGEQAETQVKRWVKATEDELYQGNITQVVARIRRLAIVNSSIAEDVEREIGYFDKHAHRMQYQKFRDEGYHIGSGIIESACNHVVAQRCKQASMKWTQQGIDAVLFWRCLLKNRSWNRFWSPQHNAA